MKNMDSNFPLPLLDNSLLEGPDAPLANQEGVYVIEEHHHPSGNVFMFIDDEKSDGLRNAFHDALSSLYPLLPKPSGKAQTNEK